MPRPIDVNPDLPLDPHLFVSRKKTTGNGEKFCDPCTSDLLHEIARLTFLCASKGGRIFPLQRGVVVLKKSLAIVCVATLFSACGGGGGGGGGGGAFPLFPAPAPAPAPSPAPDPAADTTPLSVVAFVPTASDEVPRDTEISATLNKALLASTVTDSNLRITRAGAAVPGSLSYDAASRKVSFAPAKALDLLARYTVTAGTGLKDLAGNSLAAEKSWSFRTADGTWEAPHQLEPVTAAAGHAVTAQDGQGNTVVVWASQPVGSAFEIRTAVQSAGGGWGSVSRLSTPGNYNALLPQVRFDSQGNGLAIWMQLGSADAEVWSSRFAKGTGWQTPVRLDRTINTGYGASLAVDADGNAFAVWGKRETQYGTSDIWAARFTSAGGWQAPVRLGSSANIGTYDQPSSRRWLWMPQAMPTYCGFREPATRRSGSHAIKPVAAGSPRCRWALLDWATRTHRGSLFPAQVR
ncbi:Ig-like domain-containing protein [Variovorax boronicumulans]